MNNIYPFQDLIKNLLLFLDLSKKQLADLLKIEEKVIDLMIEFKEDRYSINSLHSLTKQYSKEISDQADSVYFFERLINDFKRHHLTKDDIMFELQKKHLINDKNDSLINLYIMQQKKYFSLEEITDKINKQYYECYEIGHKAPYLKSLNRKFAEVVLNRKVQIGTRTVYEDHGGDYEVLEPQECVEVYDDGSGEHWIHLQDYSTNLNLLWKTVEKVASEGVSVRFSNKSMKNDYWWCYLDGELLDKEIVIQADNAPEALCLALIKYFETIKSKESYV